MKSVNFDFEKDMARLADIISAVEEVSNLEDSLALYKEGMALAADCARNLAAIEQEVVMLQKNTMGIFKEEKANDEF